MSTETKQDVERILRESTPRPWRIQKRCIVDSANTMLRLSGVSMPCGYVPQCDVSFINAELIASAVNSYEPLREAVKVLSEALTHQRHRDHPYTQWCDGCAKADTALARAKELL